MTVAVLMSLSIGRALAGETATAVATITAGFVTGITVTSGGSGYTSEPSVTLSGGGGSGATAKAILSGDKVALTLVLTAGSGYKASPTVTIAPPCPTDIPLPRVGNVRLNGFQLLYDIINAADFPAELFGKLAIPVAGGCTATRTNRISIRTDLFGAATNLTSSQSTCVVANGPEDLQSINLQLLSSQPEVIATTVVDQLCGQSIMGPAFPLDWGKSIVEFATNRIVVSEAGGFAQLPLQRTSRGGSLPAIAAVSLAVRVDGTGTEGVDYLRPSTATIGFGGSTNNLPLRIIDNMVSSRDMTLTLTLDAGGNSNVVVGPNASITVVVIDNDRPVPVSFVLESAPSCVVSLPNGRILVAGGFQAVGGVRRPHLARLTRELALDPTFATPPEIETNIIWRVVSLSDGAVWVVGSTRSQSWRITPEGLDHPKSWSMAVSPSILAAVADGGGGVIVSGPFSTGDSAPGGISQRNMLRFDPRGTQDPEFSANVDKSTPLTLRRFGVYPDGRLVLGASFQTSTNGRIGVLRLLPNGDVDPSLRNSGGFSNAISIVKVDRVGRMLITGRFKQYRTNATPGWVRMLEDGSWDPSFAPAVDGAAILALEVMPDGRILALEGTNLRLFSDTGVSLGIVTSNVTDFAVEPEGSLLVGSTDLPHLWRVSLGDPTPSQVAFTRNREIVMESVASVKLSVLRTGVSKSAVDVDYRVVTPHPSLGLDLGALSGTVRLAAGQSEAELVLALRALDSSSVEDREFSVQIVGARGATMSLGRDMATVEVRDEDTGLVAETFASHGINEVYSSPGTLQNPGALFWERRDTHWDRQVFFEWGVGGPNRVSTDYFAMIWSGWVIPEISGDHQFALRADDGTRIWLDDEVILDNWRPQSPALVIASSVSLQAGKPYRLCIHMWEWSGYAMCRLAWKPPGATEWATVPRRVLRPGVPRGILPTLKVTQEEDQRFRFDVTGEPGRPVRIEASTNDVSWLPISELTHSATKQTNTAFINPSSRIMVGARVRAVSVDGGIADPVYVVPLAAYLGFIGGTNVVAGLTNTATLLAYANGGANQVVRWWRNGIPTTNGVSGTRLKLSGVDPDPAGEYHFTVEAAGLRTESRHLRIGFAQKPEIGPTSDLTLQAGMPALVCLAVTGSEPLTYAWARDGSPVPGGTGAILSLPQVSAADAGRYVLTVINAAGQATSGVFAVRVVPEGTFLPSVRWESGQVIAEIPANPGPYEWQESLDLRSWSTLLRTDLTVGPFVFKTVVPAQDPARFYRLVPVP